jgi:hypothetical protein
MLMRALLGLATALAAVVSAAAAEKRRKFLLEM